jgi:hypothetical protein
MPAIEAAIIIQVELGHQAGNAPQTDKTLEGHLLQLVGCFRLKMTLRGLGLNGRDQPGHQ